MYMWHTCIYLLSWFLSWKIKFQHSVHSVFHYLFIHSPISKLRKLNYVNQERICNKIENGIQKALNWKYDSQIHRRIMKVRD